MVNKTYRFEDIFQQEESTSVEEHDIELREAISAARACLNSGAFIKYKQRIENIEKQMVDIMVAFTNDYFNEMNGDLAFYGAKIARYITKIQNVRMLLKAVQLDADRKLGDKDE